MKCRRCKAAAEVALPSHNTGFCRDCFLLYFARQVEKAIKHHRLLNRKDNILVAVSGGKDSLALIHQLDQLGYSVTGLHVDLGIPGSSPSARDAIQKFADDFDLPVEIISTTEHGLAIPEVKKRIRRPVCSVCGKIKRYYFNKYAMDNKYSVLTTGHNLDDETARLFANTLRWDVSYLSDQGPMLAASGGFVKKIKPLYRLSEYETACYCFFTGIKYHHAPCPYSSGASFTYYKSLLAELEEKMPGAKQSFYEQFLKNARPAFEDHEDKTGRKPTPCYRCGYPTSTELCGVCRIRNLLTETPGD